MNLRLLLLFVVYLGVANARTFPSTVGTTGVFVDQLPDGMTQQQMNFAATHYVGTQKMQSSWATAIRALNPNFLILHYQLAVGAGPAKFLDGNNWVNDFSTVTTHEPWFLHTTYNPTQRLEQTAWIWYLMNITDLSSTGWPQYWVTTALQRLQDNGDDAVFADSYTQDIIFGTQLTPQIKWFTDVPTCIQDYIPKLNAFGAFCHSALKAAGYYYLPNLGGLVNSWDTTNYAVGDGGMNEGFCRGSPDNYWDPSDWALASGRLITLANQNKILLCETFASETDTVDRMFVFGTYLLVRGPTSYIHMIDETANGLDGNLVWWPEYNIDLGAYTSLPASLTALYDSASGLYVRNYNNGMVVVNPTSSDVTYQLTKTWHQVGPNQVSGGGVVSSLGATSGSFGSVPVSSSTTVSAHSAVILLSSAQTMAEVMTTHSPPQEGGDGLSGGAIAGIVIGSVSGVLLIVGCLLLVLSLVGLIVYKVVRVAAAKPDDYSLLEE